MFLVTSWQPGPRNMLSRLQSATRKGPLSFKGRWSLHRATPWTRYESLEFFEHVRWSVRITELFNKMQCAWSLFYEETISSSFHRTNCLEGQIVTWYHRRTYGHIIHPGRKSLLETFEMDDIIAQADTETLRRTHSTKMSPLQYADSLWMKTLHCSQLHNKNVLKGTFVEGLPSSILHGMSWLWSSNKPAVLQKLTHRAASLKNLLERAGVDTLSSGQSSENGNKSISVVQQNAKQGEVSAVDPLSSGWQTRTRNAFWTQICNCDCKWKNGKSREINNTIRVYRSCRRRAGWPYVLITVAQRVSLSLGFLKTPGHDCRDTSIQS